MPNVVGFIGDLDLIKGFGAIGARVFGVEKTEELPLILEEAQREGCKIVFILERWAQKAVDVIENYRHRFVSLVIIPDYREEFGISNKMVKNAIVEAVGADIL